ncbi:MAG: N-acetylmuramic acid 6-phosphate etherase [Tenericutes bacterium]|jgi:N-acetylmuramic acid 6-phosphate etherase|nr:N-acetylmuramic acid 6-phosphate etherase [Mycoplasmatota bacterium]
MVDISKITTERRNANTKNMDIVSTCEILKLINEEDKLVPLAVEAAITQIADVVDVVTDAFRNNGRLFYVGAGTSGRLGVLDASEVPPTFGVDDSMVIGIIAGGDRALRNSIEGAEDFKEAAEEELKRHKITKNDVIIGIAASGITPYTIGAIEYANKVGAKSACVTTNNDSKIAKIAQYPIEAITGAEPLTGSTRMKSGTAQKLILNMITTVSMVKLGKVYENLMIDVQMSNNKLVSRAKSIVMEATGVDLKVAETYLDKYNSVKYAIFSILSEIEDKQEIERILVKHHGNVRESLKNI